MKAWSLINNAQKITLLTHRKPDGDGISSCSALEAILKKLNKDVETVYPSEPELPIKRSPSNLLINKHKQIPELIISLDTANKALLYFPEEFSNIPLINIDHHISNNIDGTVNIVEEASSTAEVLYKLLKTWCPELIDQYTAECLLCGILCDSQVFQTKSTNPNTLKLSAELIEKGADLFSLKTELLSNDNPNITKLWGELLSTMKTSKNVSWTVISQSLLKKYNLDINSLVGFNNFLSQISGMDITALFYETKDGKTKISFRSKKSDVNELAKKFGGGGHKNAAGALSDEPIDKIVKLFEEIISEK